MYQKRTYAKREPKPHVCNYYFCHETRTNWIDRAVKIEKSRRYSRCRIAITRIFDTFVRLTKSSLWRYREGSFARENRWDCRAFLLGLRGRYQLAIPTSINRLHSICKNDTMTEFARLNRVRSFPPFFECSLWKQEGARAQARERERGADSANPDYEWSLYADIEFDDNKRIRIFAALLSCDESRNI